MSPGHYISIAQKRQYVNVKYSQSKDFFVVFYQTQVVISCHG